MFDAIGSGQKRLLAALATLALAAFHGVQEPKSGVGFTVSCSAETISLLEAVSVKLTFTNNTEEDVVVPKNPFRGDYRENFVVVTKPNGDKIKSAYLELIRGTRSVDQDKSRAVVVSPGDEWTHRVLIGFDHGFRKPFFDVPGTYSVELSIETGPNGALNLRSTPFEITCEEVPSIERPAYEKVLELQDAGQLMYFYDGAFLTMTNYPVVIARLAALAELPGSAVYGSHAKFSLGSYWGTRAVGSLYRDEGEERFAKAKQLFHSIPRGFTLGSCDEGHSLVAAKWSEFKLGFIRRKHRMSEIPREKTSKER